MPYENNMEEDLRALGIEFPSTPQIGVVAPPRQQNADMEADLRAIGVEFPAMTQQKAPSTFDGAINAAKSVGRFAGSVAQSIVKPIAQTAVQMPRSFISGVSGIGAALGDPASAKIHEQYTRPVNVPFLGEVRTPSAVPSDVERYGAQSAGQSAGQALEMAASLVPMGKSTTGFGAVKEAAKQGGKVGALVGAGTAMRDKNATLGSVAAGTALGGGTGGVFGGGVAAVGQGIRKIAQVVSPRAKDALVSAIKPAKNNTNFKKDLDVVMSELSDGADKIDSLQKLDIALKTKKVDVWKKVGQKLAESGDDATIDLGDAADAIEKIAKKPIFKLEDGSLSEKLIERAKGLRSAKLSPIEAEDILEDLNARLESFYRKNQVSQSLAQKADPSVAADIALADSIRKGLDKSLSGFADLKRTYGALANVSKEVAGRIPVMERQNIMSLAEQISGARTAGNVMGSVLSGNFGNALGHVFDVFTAGALKAADSSDRKVAAAFSQLAKKSATQQAIGKITGAIGSAYENAPKGLLMKAAALKAGRLISGEDR